jgi:hypothetical protein
MHITKSQIEDRKAQLVEQRESVRVQAEANINAFNGAIEDCDYWLGVLEDDESGATPHKKK